MTNEAPRITVLMPVFNCEAFVGEAIESILDQSFSNYEFLIIDDASTDNTRVIVKSYQDPRITLIEKVHNTGYTRSLNYGLSIAKGVYIARMDGDDISLPERFEKQVSYMDGHPEVVVCGTIYSIIGSDAVKKVPITHDDCKVQLLKKTCFGHPTVMMRQSVFEAHGIKYDVTKEPAEDYDLWVTLLAYGKFYNLPEVLLNYRVHDTQISVKKAKQKFISYYIIKERILNYLNVKLSLIEQKVFKKILYRQIIDYDDFFVYEAIRGKFLEANKKEFFKVSVFQSYMNEIEFLICKDYFLNRKTYTPNLIVHYLIITRKFNFYLSLRNQCKLIAKSLFFYRP